MTDCWSTLEFLDGPVRMAVVGLGNRGKKHAAVIEACNATRLVGLCDLRAEALLPYGSTVPTSTDAARLLAETGPSGAVVAVPHDAYVPLIGHYLANGVSCLKEKPLARTLPEAWHLERLVTEGAGKLAIAAQRRHGDVLSTVKAILGRSSRPPIAFEYVYTLGLAPGDQDWRSSRSLAGGGAILDMGYHVLDFLTALLGVPQSVSAFAQQTRGPHQGGVENGATLLLTYPGGTTGTVIISRHLTPPEERATFWLEDERLEFDGRRLTALRGDRRTWLADTQSGEELMHRQLHDFLALHEGRPSQSCDVASALDSMRTIGLCYEALDGGGMAHAPQGTTPRPVIDNRV